MKVSVPWCDAYRCDVHSIQRFYFNAFTSKADAFLVVRHNLTYRLTYQIDGMTVTIP